MTINSHIKTTQILDDGFWLLLDSSEQLFVSFVEFPWFKNASAEQLNKIERPHEHHLYWPDLDIDLEVESIRHPELYPLKSTTR